MRPIDYLPHGPAISTPATERVRDGIAARHRLSRTRFALVICIFVSLTSALSSFGHNTPEVRNGDQIHFTGNPFDKETENWQNYEHWREFIATHPDQEYRTDHWHFDIEDDSIGSWDPCLVDVYNEATDSYGLVEGNCSGGTSTDLIAITRTTHRKTTRTTHRKTTRTTHRKTTRTTHRKTTRTTHRKTTRTTHRCSTAQ